MYVCICKAVTDTQIRTAVDHGCCSMRDLRNELGVATQCGRCAVACREVLDEALQDDSRRLPGAA
ncbi:MAG TPA: bacterioferritin-associated ferredoxin [Moraxellaceae bacterium]|nr:bacterioferritin-associated ferredoxin [Moraxellaceae bacterium]